MKCSDLFCFIQLILEVTLVLGINYSKESVKVNLVMSDFMCAYVYTCIHIFMKLYI